MTEYPAGWNHRSTLPDEIMATVCAADCCWLQVVTGLGFALAAVLAGCEDDPELRLAVGEVMAAKLLETARTGRIPGEMLQ